MGDNSESTSTIALDDPLLKSTLAELDYLKAFVSDMCFDITMALVDGKRIWRERSSRVTTVKDQLRNAGIDPDSLLPNFVERLKREAPDLLEKIKDNLQVQAITHPKKIKRTFAVTVIDADGDSIDVAVSQIRDIIEQAGFKVERIELTDWTE